MSKRFSILVTIIFVGLVVFWFLPNSRGRMINFPSSGSRVVAFGDSLVAGVGSESGGGFIKMLSEDLGVEIINLGVSGNTTKDALSRVGDIEGYQPKTVIVLLGGNDFLRKVPEEETFQNLEKIIVEIQSLGANVLLLGVRSGVLSSRFDSAFEELSERLGTAYVPDVLDGVWGKPSLMADSLHPNDLGYRIIAQMVSPVLVDLIR